MCKNQRSAGPDERLSFCLRKSRVCRTLMMPHGPRQAIYRIYSYLKIRHNFQRFPPRWSYGPTKMVAFLVKAVLIPVLGTGPSGPGIPGEAVCAESVASGPKVLDVLDVAWETLRNNTLEYVTNIPCLWISRLWKNYLPISSNVFNLHEDGKGIGASWSFLQLAKSRQSGHGKVLTGFRQESGGQGGNGQSLSRLKLSIQLPYVHKTHQKCCCE